MRIAKDRPWLIVALVAVVIAVLVTSVLMVVRNGQITDGVLWAVKVLGAALTVGAGVAGLFSTSAVDKNNRLTPIGVTFIVAIGLGAASSMTAEWIADSAAKKQADVVMSTLQLTATDVERHAFPIKDIRFSIELEVNLAHPQFRAMASKLRAVAEKYAPDFSSLGPDGTSVLGGTGIGAAMSVDKQLKLVVYDNTAVLPRVDGDDPAANILYSPNMTFDIYHLSKITPTDLRAEASPDDARHSNDFTTRLPTDSQEEIFYQRSLNRLGRDLRYRVYYVPKTGQCYVDYFVIDPSAGENLKATSGSLMGVPDLAGSQFVFRLGGYDPQYWSKSPPLELSQVEMFVGSRRWTLTEPDFDRYVDKLGYLVYSYDAPSDISAVISKMRAVPQTPNQGLTK